MEATNRDVLEVIFGPLAVRAIEENGPYVLRDEITQARVNAFGNCAIGEASVIGGLYEVASCPTPTAVITAANRRGAIRPEDVIDAQRVLRDVSVANDGGRFRDRDSIATYLDAPVQIGTKLRERIALAR